MNYKLVYKKIMILIIVCFIYVINIYSDPIQTDVPALKDVFKNDFTFGCLLSYRNIGFPDDPKIEGQSPVVTPDGGSLIKYHMNSMSPGNNMKAMYTVDITASAKAYNEAEGDKRKYVETHPVVRFNGDLIAQLDWAKRNGFTFRGHTLVWHSQTPAELFRSGYSQNNERLTKELMIERMDNYIHEVIRLIHENWPGMLSAIDVVNEAVDDSGKVRTSGNEWYMTVGDDSYIMKAFEFARKYTVEYGEKQIMLYYNDYGTSSQAKADGIVRLCKPVYDAGFLDGIGMQEHDAVSYPGTESWIKSYEKFDTVCNEMAITELDVALNNTSNLPIKDMLQKQANQYAALFKCFVERSYKSGRGKIINVSKDGLNDQYTFQTNQFSSLWDIDNQCKPAFYSVVDVTNFYNELSVVMAYAKKQVEKKAFNWKKIQAEMNNAKAAMKKNYSYETSAVYGLRNALKNLKSVLKMK